MLEEYIKNIGFRRSKKLSENVKYIGKYFPYYKDCTDFYFKFVPNFLNFHKSIINVVNHNLRNCQIKEKVLVIFGKEFRIKLQRVNRKIKFLHKLKNNEYVELYNNKGNFKQFVKGSVYKEINDFLYTVVAKNKYQRAFIKAMKKRYKKELVPYHIYIADNYVLNHQFNIPKGV